MRLKRGREEGGTPKWWGEGGQVSASARGREVWVEIWGRLKDFERLGDGRETERKEGMCRRKGLSVQRWSGGNVGKCGA